MWQKIGVHCFVAGALLVSMSAVHAQRAQDKSLPLPPPPGMSLAEDADVGPIDSRLELLGFEPGPAAQTVKNAPFSAEAVTETEQTLSDGNRIHRKTESKMYRDSAGRTRREGALPELGLFVASKSSGSFISIYDAVTGTNYVLQPDLKTARALRALPPLPPLPARDLKDKHAEAESDRGSSKPVVESLGTRTIEGIAAEGVRYTWTIPAGQIGNEQPIVITLERWYSPELKLLVMSKRNDPRFGETTYRLVNIDRQEPAASLFRVPREYTVKKEARQKFDLDHRP